MTPIRAHIKRLRPAVAVICGLAAPCAALAQDAFTRSLGNAFETIVIDAGKAAAQATSAAKGAISGNSKRKASKKSDDATADSGETNADDGAPAEIALPIRKPKPDYGPSVTATPDPVGEERTAMPAPAPKPHLPGHVKPSTPEPAPAPPPAKKADKKKEMRPDEWPAEDVELARARCTRILKDLDVVTVPEPPMRKGDCGAHAPVRLISIGKSPEVTISPPAVVSCDMVASLHKWVTKDLQPLAKRHLGAEIIKIEAMSDYSCRMAYGRVGNKLSEHGKANALDIGGFMTRKGKTAHLLTGWGPNRRDIARKIAAEKAAEAKVAAEKAAAEKAELAKAAATGKPVPRATIVDGLPREDDKTNPLAKQASLNIDEPVKAPVNKKKTSRRGKLPPEILEHMPKERAPARDSTARFLYAAHDAACKIFGTTLGPEANEAHRNHFHVDMAPRKFKNYCR